MNKLFHPENPRVEPDTAPEVKRVGKVVEVYVKDGARDMCIVLDVVLGVHGETGELVRAVP